MSRLAEKLLRPHPIWPCRKASWTADKPKVSVIIPVYNDEPFLRQALDSAANQPLLEIEIICVNDASMDGTDAILRDYAGKDDRVCVIDTKNMGLLTSRRVGGEAVNREYCLFWTPTTLVSIDRLQDLPV